MSEATTHKNPAGTLETTPGSALTRRKVLKGIIGLLAAIGLGNVLYGMYRFWAPGAGEQTVVEMALNIIPEGGTVQFQYGGTPGMLFRAEDGSFKAFSLVCTHLACTVSWNPEKREFYCPCHEGFFDAEGKVLSGPPPAPLERWKVEVRGDKVVVGA
jgi:cytochrome b6-f complex iron-sulfur subunit